MVKRSPGIEAQALLALAALRDDQLRPAASELLKHVLRAVAPRFDRLDLGRQ